MFWPVTKLYEEPRFPEELRLIMPSLLLFLEVEVEESERSFPVVREFPVIDMAFPVVVVLVIILPILLIF
jgi:hypothetical protein